MAELRLRDLIKRRPITVTSDATVHDIIKIMAQENIGFLIVREGGQVVGVLSERDVIRVLAEEGDLRKRIGEFCKRDIIKLRADSTLEEAAQTMGRHRIRHIVVEDERGELLGVVSVRDLLEELFGPGTKTD